ncbi:Putative uncharacterized protein [Lacticaseibacillus paracasei]
MSKEV